MEDTIADLTKKDALALADSYAKKSYALQSSFSEMLKQQKANPALAADSIFSAALSQLKSSLDSVKSFTSKWEDKGALDRYTNQPRPGDANFDNMVADITSNKGDIQGSVDLAIKASNQASAAAKASLGSGTTADVKTIDALVIPDNAQEKAEKESERQAQIISDHGKEEILSTSSALPTAAASSMPTSNVDPDADKFAAQAASKAKSIVESAPSAAPVSQYTEQELAYFDAVAAKDEALKAHGLSASEIKESIDKDNAAMIEWANANPEVKDQGDPNAHIPSIGAPAAAAMTGPVVANASGLSDEFRPAAAMTPQYSAQELAFFAQIQSQIDAGLSADQINSNVAALAANVGGESAMPIAQPPAPTFNDPSYNESTTYGGGGGTRFK